MNTKVFFFLIVFLLTACKVTPTVPTETSTAEVINKDSGLPVLGNAPELSNETWLNTDEPLRLANLKGKVVLLEMWTFG